MVPTSYFQRRHAGLHASFGLAGQPRLRAAALPFYPLEPASAACRRGMALAMTPLNQSGVSA